MQSVLFLFYVYVFIVKHQLLNDCVYLVSLNNLYIIVEKSEIPLDNKVK